MSARQCEAHLETKGEDAAPGCGGVAGAIAACVALPMSPALGKRYMTAVAIACLGYSVLVLGKHGESGVPQGFTATYAGYRKYSWGYFLGIRESRAAEGAHKIQQRDL